MTTPNTARHPQGFYLILSCQVLMSYSFFTGNALLALYLNTDLHLGTAQTISLVAANTALLFITQLFGGWFNNRFLSYRQAILLGCISVIIGFLLLASQQIALISESLAAICLGFGIILPGLMCLLSQCYDEGDSRRDNGFTVSYVACNISALLAFMLGGILAHAYSFSFAFIVAAITMLITLIVFALLGTQLKQPKRTNASPRKHYAFALFIIAYAVLIFIFQMPKLTDILIQVLGVFILIGLIITATKQPVQVRRKLFAFIILITVGITFWALYMVSLNCLPLFFEHNVNRQLFYWQLPAASVSSINPIFIIFIGFVLCALWRKLSKKNSNPTVTHKYATGILLMGIGYLILTAGLKFANAAGLVGLGWIALSYLFQTAGELLVGPTGNAMVGTLVPKRLESTMFGVLCFSVGFASALSSDVAAWIDFPTQHNHPLQTDAVYATTFSHLGLMAIAVALLLFAAAKSLNRLITTEAGAIHVND